MTLNDLILLHTGKPGRECHHQHQMQGTGGHFYHSMGLLYCSRCGGWQLIRKPIPR